jgi:hypothetical protein
MRSSLRFLGASVLALGVLGVGTAVAAPGGGAVSAPTTCLVSVPGFPDATGTGRVVITPKGEQRVNCHAQFPAGTTLPEKNMRFDSGPCTIFVTVNGYVTAHC